jgi:hypothetical protein
MHDVTYWPESLQRPLLRAAFLPGAAGVAAWEMWRSQVRMEDHADPGSFRLLPRVCRNMRQHGIDDPLLAKLTGIARQSWFKQQSAFRTLAPHLQSLRAAGVDVLMLGSMAAALRCSDDPCESEPVWSWLVRPDQAVAALRRLRSSGWRLDAPPPDPLLRAYVAHRSAQTFCGPDEQRLELSWQWWPGHSDDEVWRAAEKGEVHTVPVFLLAPADHVLYACAQAKPRYWRAIEVMLVVEAVHGNVDWARLESEARRRRLEPAVAETLSYIQDALDAPLPPDVVTRLAAAPPVAPVRAPNGAGSPHPTIRQEVSRLWASHRECSDGLGLGRRLFYFPKYLQYVWRLEHVRQVPRRALASTRYLLR